MDKKQFKKNIKWINKKIKKQYPEVELIYPFDGNPEIRLPVELEDQQDAIIAKIENLISQCGGDVEFYPEKASRI